MIYLLTGIVLVAILAHWFVADMNEVADTCDWDDFLHSCIADHKDASDL
jgi:hypothetical protein